MDPKLPPFGFYVDRCSWDSIKTDTPLLYRVHHGSCRTPFCGNGSHGDNFAFISQRLAARKCTSSEQSGKPTYEEAYNFVSRSKHPNGYYLPQDYPRYISTTASLAFALRLCNQHYIGVGNWPSDKDVQLVVIDAAQVTEQAYTTFECLTSAREDEKDAISKQFNSKADADAQHDFRLRIANASQEVLIADFILKSAIVRVLRFDELLAFLPPWFLNEDKSFISSVHGPATGCSIRDTFYSICTKYEQMGICPSGAGSQESRLLAFRAADFMTNEPCNTVTFGQSRNTTAEDKEVAHKIRLLTYVAYYLLSFPIAKWALDPFRVSQARPRQTNNIDVVFSQHERDKFNAFIERKYHERELQEQLTDDLMQKLLGSFRVEGVPLSICDRERQTPILTQIQRVMKQRLLCFYRSTEKLDEVSKVISVHLRRIRKYAINPNKQKFSDALKALERDLETYSSMSIRDGDDDSGADDMEEDTVKEVEVEKPVILPQINVDPTNYFTQRRRAKRRAARSARGIPVEDIESTLATEPGCSNVYGGSRSTLANTPHNSRRTQIRRTEN